MILPGRVWLVMGLVAPLIPGCGPASADPCSPLDRSNVEDCLRLNQLQVLGSHNSYHLPPLPRLVEELNAHRPGWAEDILYAHRPLGEQLASLGIRQLELDIFADPAGGLYARPEGAEMVGDTEYLEREEMRAPGFKVLHAQDLDYRSTCLTFTSCLRELKLWSDAHPRHFPVLVLVEVKDKPPEDGGDFPFVVPVAVDEELMRVIDVEIWSVFEPEDVLTPDLVRTGYPTLEKAVLERGWPTLRESRGRILFALDNTGTHRDAYLAGTPNLEGRAMFVSSPPGEPTAAFIKMNDVLAEESLIREWVAAGYLVRTRADIPLEEARSGDVTRREAALRSGAQFISTDFPEPGPFGSDYVVRLPGTGGVARCNPVSAPNGCRNDWLVE